MSCFDPKTPCSIQEVDRAFRESEPYIDQQVKAHEHNMKRYYVDYASVEPFMDGIGHTMSTIVWHPEMGPQFENFDIFNEEAPSGSIANGDCVDNDACGYNWVDVHNGGFEEKHFRLMTLDLKTKPICINDIRTYWQFEQFQNLIFRNLAEISANIKEQMNRNALINFATKYVITSKGLEQNPGNPYCLPNIKDVELGKLNFRILKRLYSSLHRMASMHALTTQNGRPMFGLVASEDVLDDLFYEDQEIRNDLRESSMADSLLTRYNFMETVRNMFVTIPDMYAPRYKVDENGNLCRVFPYEREVPIQSGTRSFMNPDYEKAEYELVLLLTKDVFSLAARPSISSVGGQTNFEPTPSSLLEWKWFNPERECDPLRRVGFYFANMQVGIKPGHFTDFPAILVKRRPFASDSCFWAPAECPPEETECDNHLKDITCPCPQVVGCCEDKLNPNALQFDFSRDVTPYVVGGNIQIELSNGGIAEGAITLSPDGTAGVVDFGEPKQCCPELYVQIVCGERECYADVLIEVCSDTVDGDRVLKLDCLLVEEAAVGAIVKVVYKDGTTSDVEITAIDYDTLEYEVTPVEGKFDGRRCIKKLCVPTELNPDCPSCENELEVCQPKVEEEGEKKVSSSTTQGDVAIKR